MSITLTSRQPFMGHVVDEFSQSSLATDQETKRRKKERKNTKHI